MGDIYVVSRVVVIDTVILIRVHFFSQYPITQQPQACRNEILFRILLRRTRPPFHLLVSFLVLLLNTILQDGTEKAPQQMA